MHVSGPCPPTPGRFSRPPPRSPIGPTRWTARISVLPPRRPRRPIFHPPQHPHQSLIQRPPHRPPHLPHSQLPPYLPGPHRRSLEPHPQPSFGRPAGCPSPPCPCRPPIHRGPASCSRTRRHRHTLPDPPTPRHCFSPPPRRLPCSAPSPRPSGSRAGCPTSRSSPRRTFRRRSSAALVGCRLRRPFHCPRTASFLPVPMWWCRMTPTRLRGG